ncbi:hypothetical protein P691DRAFT_757537 [Macrolepiota fuliginosa MF-IS2]|uniref:Uncharacterized protein n=1 Tax=Macrolepiota fuliginosa MF-IS2 TaxID=1400762 RepID=A0A9P5XIU8_9AGAR|nr:hypothetical protein P691DRAFT_757537 [Macrolepiota fuliginosa MF-IS2]
MTILPVQEVYHQHKNSISRAASTETPISLFVAAVAALSPFLYINPMFYTPTSITWEVVNTTSPPPPAVRTRSAGADSGEWV